MHKHWWLSVIRKIGNQSVSPSFQIYLLFSFPVLSTCVCSLHVPSRAVSYCKSSLSCSERVKAQPFQGLPSGTERTDKALGRLAGASAAAVAGGKTASAKTRAATAASSRPAHRLRKRFEIAPPIAATAN
eukprot:GHVT01102120.1.p2 GENE.GHVT01102120.1~~GHVT01102120.1.p2  ORF type:complete len:130 (-),score=14.91 GHVT01102120.1:328-717(-)